MIEINLKKNAIQNFKLRFFSPDSSGNPLCPDFFRTQRLQRIAGSAPKTI